MSAITEDDSVKRFRTVFFYIAIRIEEHYYPLAVVAQKPCPDPKNLSPTSREVETPFVAYQSQQIYLELYKSKHYPALAKERDRAIKEYQNHNGRGSLLLSTPSPPKFPDTAQMLLQCRKGGGDRPEWCQADVGDNLIDTDGVYNAVIFDITDLKYISMACIQRIGLDSVLAQWPKTIKEYWEKSDPKRRLPHHFKEFLPATLGEIPYRVEITLTMTPLEIGILRTNCNGIVWRQ